MNYDINKKPTVKDLLMPDAEERWKMLCEAAWTVWVRAPWMLAVHMGKGWDEGNAFLQRWTRYDGTFDGPDGVKALGIKEKSARAAAAAGLFLLTNTLMNKDFEIVKWEPDLAVVRWRDCLQWEIAKKHNCAKDFKNEQSFDCVGICRNWWGVLARCVSADLVVSFQPAMPEGGEYCQLKIQKITEEKDVQSSYKW